MKPFNECEPRRAAFNHGDYALHGDVILERIKSLPSDFLSMEKSKDGALAYGEATGHIHLLFGDKFDLREDSKTKVKFLRIVEPTALKHQEHAPIIIPPGDYKIGIQREYDPFEKRSRQVVD